MTANPARLLPDELDAIEDALADLAQDQEPGPDAVAVLVSALTRITSGRTRTFTGVLVDDAKAGDPVLIALFNMPESLTAEVAFKKRGRWGVATPLEEVPT